MLTNCDAYGGLHCPDCGAYHHFSRPCPRCMGPNRAVLPPPRIAVGAWDATEARQMADAARTAAGDPAMADAAAAALERLERAAARAAWRRGGS